MFCIKKVTAGLSYSISCKYCLLSSSHLSLSLFLSVHLISNKFWYLHPVSLCSLIYSYLVSLSKHIILFLSIEILSYLLFVLPPPPGQPAFSMCPLPNFTFIFVATSPHDFHLHCTFPRFCLPKKGNPENRPNVYSQFLY